MIPPIVALALQNPALVDLLGDDPFRFFAFGDAGDNTVYPYATYQIVSGSPENFLAGRPDADGWNLQIDCWAKSEADVLEVAKELRDSLELDSYITSWNGTSRDPVTRNYRFSFSVDFITER